MRIYHFSPRLLIAPPPWCQHTGWEHILTKGDRFVTKEAEKTVFPCYENYSTFKKTVSLVAPTPTKSRSRTPSMIQVPPSPARSRTPSGGQAPSPNKLKFGMAARGVLGRLSSLGAFGRSTRKSTFSKKRGSILKALGSDYQDLVIINNNPSNNT
jgi:hypothetical protein